MKILQILIIVFLIAGCAHVPKGDQTLPNGNPVTEEYCKDTKDKEYCQKELTTAGEVGLGVLGAASLYKLLNKKKIVQIREWFWQLGEQQRFWNECVEGEEGCNPPVWSESDSCESCW